MPTTSPISTTASTTTCTATARAGCVELAAVFQDPLMEEPPTTNSPAGVRRHYAIMLSSAEQACEACPLLTDCLYRAVVEHDVAGYVAGTTAAQRTQIRRRLQVTVEPEDFDTLAGVVGRHRQVDHDEVVRLRNANPHESLEQLAHRLGCSLSTVKRHLRRNRHEGSPTSAPVRTRPTTEDVLAATAAVIGQSTRQGHAA